MTTASRGRARIGAMVGIAIAALVVAAACSSPTEAPGTIYVTPTPGAITPLPSGVTPEPDTIPTVDNVIISTDAPDKKWKVTFKKPVISGISDAAMTKMNDTITALVNGYISDFTGSSLPTPAAGAAPSTLEGNYSIALRAPDVISLRFTMITNVVGSAHPNGKPGSINMAVKTGAKINLSDLFTDPGISLPSIVTKTKADLTKQLGTDLTWDGKASSLDFFGNAWVLTADGLEFNFEQGKMASAAAGMPSTTLTWSSLKALIKPTGPAGGFTR